MNRELVQESIRALQKYTDMPDHVDELRRILHDDQIDHPPTSTFQTSLAKEHAELDQKYQALNNFIDHSDVFLALPDEDRLLLRMQWSIMSVYKDILHQRLLRLEKSHAHG